MSQNNSQESVKQGTESKTSQKENSNSSKSGSSNQDSAAKSGSGYRDNAEVNIDDL